MSTKVTDLTALATTPEDSDELHIVDVSDTTGTAAGTSKRIDVSVLMGKAPVQSVNGDTGTVVLEMNDIDDVNAGSPSDNIVLSYDTATSKYIPDTRLTTLYNEFRSGTTTDVQNGASTDSKLELTATTAKMKTGVTEVALEETSPGEIDFIVAAGTSGAETAFTAVEINGQAVANNALFDVKTGTRLRIESSTNDFATLRNQASADTVIDLPTSTGTIALTSDITAAPVDSVNGATGTVVLDADDISDSSTTNKFTTAADITKLAGIEASADVTDTANVTAAGALMDSEVTNLAQVKAFDSSDYATAAQGTTADSALQDVIDDTSPELGGDLDVKAQKITTSTSNGNIELDPNGTGLVQVNGDTNPGAIKLMCENGSHGVTIKSPAHSAAATYTLTLPDDDGTANQVLKTDGSGNLSWVDQSGGGGGSGVCPIATISGRLQITTARDAGEDNVVFGGGYGVQYYNWTTDVFTAANAVSSGLGTPGTSTFSNGTGYSIANGLLYVPQAGTAKFSINIEFPSSTDVQGQDFRFFMWKIGSAEVTAIEDGTYDSSWSGTLVASATVTCPSSLQNIIPMAVQSSNGSSIAEGDYVFMTAVWDGTVGGTRYFTINCQMFST